MRNESDRVGGAIVAAALFLIVATAGWAHPQGAEEPTFSPASGRVTYRSYCQNCHGLGGEGDGYIADTLRKVPSDLTTIAVRHGGEFPADQVRATIDGRAEVKAHGRRDMPLWGDVFLWPEDEGPERRRHVERKIGELMAYLETLQKPAAEESAP